MAAYIGKIEAFEETIEPKLDTTEISQNINNISVYYKLQFNTN
jgi:hypothetical protein